VSTSLEVELWKVPTPIPTPVLTPAGPYETFFHVVVVARSPGHEGWGYSALATTALLDAAVASAAELLERPAPSLDALLSVEHQPRRGDRTAWHAATNAIALAAWDLAGRELGIACADLWGRRPGTDALDAYASGYFLDATLDALVREAERDRAAGYRFVKMRVGLDVDTDLQRYDAVRGVFPDDGCVAVDAVCSWTPDAAREFVDRAAARLLWLEDPTPYADLTALGALAAPLAIGESVQDVAELEVLRRTCGFDAGLLDVQQLGGPVHFFGAANALAVQGVTIGSHIYTGPSAHLLACLDDPLPLEVFDWSDLLMDPPPTPDLDGRVPVRGPGFGVALRHETLDRHGTLVLSR
jgi:L-alanine-DL-glutamate epimerase-like enolase superfamily enzyme